MTTYRPSCQLIFACVLGMSLTDTAAAYYSPTLGRFLSRDPLNYVDGPALYRAYFVPSGRDPTGKVVKIDKKTCQSLVDSLKKEAPISGQLQGLGKLKDCKEPPITCGDCLPGEAGGYDPTSKTIKICTTFPDDADIVEDVRETIIHELIHASDDCQWKLPDPQTTKPSCAQWLCIEARAISCSNDCLDRDDPNCVRNLLLTKVAYNTVLLGEKAFCPSNPIESTRILENVLKDARCKCDKPCGKSPPQPPVPPPGYDYTK